MTLPGEGLATLGRLVEDLGLGIIEVLAAPNGLDVPIVQEVIADPSEPVDAAPGDLILAVGVGPGDRQTRRLLEGAAHAGAAAVGIKVRESDDAGPAVATAEQLGVALLAITPEITWAHLHSLVRTAMASAGHAPESAAGDVPVGDLFALANAVAAIVGGPVSIEDPKSRVMAYSSLDDTIDEPRRQTIIGRQVPEKWLALLRKRGTFKQLWTSGDVVEIRDLGGAGELRPRLAIAVTAGDEILGSIWVAEGELPFTEDSKQALRQAAQIAALHLVRHRVGDDLEARRQGELVRSLLQGRGSVALLASRLGLDVTGHHVVIGVELAANEDERIELLRDRVLRVVSMYSQTFRRRAATAAIGRVVYAVLPLDADETTTAVVRLASEIVERPGPSLSVELRAGIGSVVEGLGDVVKSRAEADQVLRLLATRANPPSVAAIDDLRAPALLLELTDVAGQLTHLRSGKLWTLVECDKVEGTEYVATLRAYLAWFGKVPEAAESLGVHPNTFRYRLRRLSEVSAIDLDDPDERLAVEIQLRFS